MPIRIPPYREFKPRRKGYVRCKAVFGTNNRHHFPGDYNSPESRAAYFRFVAEHFPSHPSEVNRVVTVRMLGEQYLDDLLAKSGKSPRYHHVRGLMSAIYRANHAATVATSFGPLALQEVRAVMVAGWDVPKRGNKSARRVQWSRSFINDQVRRLCQVFRFGVIREIVTAAQWQNLKAVPGLRKGETTAPERPPVESVSWDTVAAVLPFCTPTLAAMVELQHLTAMRSQSLCGITEGQINKSGAAWIYQPVNHKTKHLDKTLTVYLGPRCQKILTPFLGKGDDVPLFSPKDSEAHRKAVMRANRQTVDSRGWKLKVQPSQQNRAKLGAKRKPGDKYTTKSYRRAVASAIDKAKAPHFFPHQIRHSRSDEIKRLYDVETSTAYCGHSSIPANEIYNERDAERAIKVALEIG